MKLTIFNTYVKVTDQPQADRLKAVCEKYGLPIWENAIAFKYNLGAEKTKQPMFDYFGCFQNNEFYLGSFFENDKPKNKSIVTESQFIALCEEWVKNK